MLYEVTEVEEGRRRDKQDKTKDLDKNKGNECIKVWKK
jgi:hypothetical protein